VLVANQSLVQVRGSDCIGTIVEQAQFDPPAEEAAGTVDLFLPQQQ
jgi:hypothetical protein